MSSVAVPRRSIVRRLSIAPLVAGIGLAGCAASAAPPSDPVARIIVRFRTDTPNPVDARSLAALAHRAGVTGIDLLRPMSGESYVLTMRCGAARDAGDDPCGAALARLAAVDVVVSAEFDRRVRHQ